MTGSQAYFSQCERRIAVGTVLGSLPNRLTSTPKPPATKWSHRGIPIAASWKVQLTGDDRTRAALASLSQTTQLRPPQSGRGGHEDRPRILWSPGLLGGIDQGAHFFWSGHHRRDVRDRRWFGPLRRVRVAPSPSTRLREHRRETAMNVMDAACRQPAPLVLAVKIGERLGRHLGHRHDPSVGSMLWL